MTQYTVISCNYKENYIQLNMGTRMVIVNNENNVTKGMEA